MTETHKCNLGSVNENEIFSKVNEIMQISINFFLRCFFTSVWFYSQILRGHQLGFLECGGSIFTVSDFIYSYNEIMFKNL